MNDNDSPVTRTHKHASGSRLITVFCLGIMVLFAATVVACSPSGTGEAAARTTNPADGAALFESLGCTGCHEENGAGRGPSLVGLYGQTIALENGQTATADEQYIRTAILNPGVHTRAGYQPIMPPYGGRINDEELSTIVDYVLSLNGGD